jgi:CheY-like chemotaxis protein
LAKDHALDAGRSRRLHKNTLDPSTHFNLLLVEDHKMNQLVAKKTLERQFPNIKISIAENGKEAIAMLEKKTFSIVLMDLQMPVMDGQEATKYIREQMQEPISSIPILAMTAHAHISKDEQFKDYGMDDFVLKPFEPEQLFEKISINIRLEA